MKAASPRCNGIGRRLVCQVDSGRSGFTSNGVQTLGKRVPGILPTCTMSKQMDEGVESRSQLKKRCPGWMGGRLLADMPSGEVDKLAGMQKGGPDA